MLYPLAVSLLGIIAVSFSGGVSLRNAPEGKEFRAGGGTLTRPSEWASVGSFRVAGIKGRQSGLVPPLSREIADLARDLTVTFFDGEHQVGQGVLVARGGKVLTSGEVAFDSAGNPRGFLTGLLSDGKRYGARVEAFDPVTDMALVTLVGIDRLVSERWASLSASDPRGVVLVVLPSGPERGEVSRVGTPGVLGPLNRFTLLNEFRFERGSGRVVGSPVFGPDGKLVGLLMAALATPMEAMKLTDAEGVGPRSAVTTFSVSVLMLRRVVSGLTSPSGHVQHPWIGVFVQATSSGQTVITQVVNSSPAAIAGLLPGDRIVMAGGNVVRSPVDFARYLSELAVGSVADLVIERGAMRKKVAVAVVADPTSKITVLRRNPRGGGEGLVSL
jgi:S1-C subfamily serine protease